MKATKYLEEFQRRVKKTHPDNFSTQGLELLFQYIEQTDEDWFFDIGKITECYAELSFEDFADKYSVESNRQAIESGRQEIGFLIGFTSSDTVVYGSF